jgi:hypothetical protein
VIPRSHPFRREKPVHCRDERIAKTGNLICTKQAQSVAELISNYCQHCGRPFVLENSLLGEKYS